MTLTLHRHRVDSVAPGAPRGLADGRLGIDADGLRDELLARDGRLAAVRVDCAHPGETTRIVCVKDVIQPRARKTGSGPDDGIVCVLDNVAVVTCGPIVGFQEGIVDMSGPGAAYTPFSAMPLITLEISVADGLEPHEHEAALREAGMAAAEAMARACLDREPEDTETIDWKPVPDGTDLPRIALVYMVLSQGLLHDTYVQGRNAREGLPATLDPRIVLDNGILSGNCVSACDKNTTYHHQNNPLIAELLRGHGTEWDFAGVVVSNAPTRLAEKERCAQAAVEQAVALGAAGAVVSKEGFGNPDADLMMLIRGLEAAGIRTVGITDEFAGTDGGSQSLADTTPEADAIVSVGNANERVELPAMETVIGPLPDVARLAGGYPHSLRDDGTMEIELQAVIGSTNELGFGRLSCREA